jgi:hypothetical protein
VPGPDGPPPPGENPPGPTALARRPDLPSTGPDTRWRTLSAAATDGPEVLLPGEFPPDDDGYHPPPPPPLPRPSLSGVSAVLAILGGAVLFFRPGLLGAAEPVALLLGVLGILGGTAALVWRLREGSGEDDDPDDGAVV